ncbi:MAG: hypothetical protein PHD05_00205 [Sphaerochaetaceae bacterium]|nr:hypothetical protein [Sphaerochaetaceae bacterium]
MTKSEYEKLFEEYTHLHRQKDRISETMNEIKEKIAQLMHEDKINIKDVTLENGENWCAAYQNAARNSTDLKLLMEVVGPLKYNEIVSTSNSTFLVIRKKKKTRKSEKSQERPIDDDITPIIPPGMILS